MKAKLLFLFTLISLAYQLRAQVFNKKAIELNDKAVKNLQGNGSLNYRIEKSNRLLDSAILIEPKYTIAYQNKLNNLITIKSYNEAIAVANSLYKMKPSIEIGTAKSALLHKKGNFEEARSNFDQVIKQAERQYHDKPNSTLLCNIAVAHFLNNQRQKAFDLLDSQINKFNDKDKKQINAFKRLLPSFTYDEILNSHKAVVKPNKLKNPVL